MRCPSPRLIVLYAFIFNLLAGLLTYAATPQKPRFAYVANNQDGTVSVFEIDNAMLRARDYAYVAGSSPLSLALTPSQKFLYGGSNGSVGLLGFAVNAETGQLKALPNLPSTGGLIAVAVAPSGAFLVTVDGSSVQSFQINNQNGSLTSAGFASADSPWSLAFHPSGKYVYSSDVNNDEITALTLDPTTGALTPVAGSPFPTNSQNPIACAIDPAGHFLFVANANGANVSVFAIDASTGALTEVQGSPFQTGGGPDALAVSPNGQFLYAANSFDKTISAFAINSTTGSLTPVTGSPFSNGASGALGLTIDSSGTHLYSMDHDTNEVVTFGLNSSTGALTLEQTVRSRGAAISMAIVSGKTPATYLPKSVYVSNAVSNNISAYSITQSTGSLTPIAGSPFATGPFPWAIASDAAGRFLFTGNQGNLTVSSFTVNATTGGLTPAPGSPFPVGSQPTSVAVDNGAHYVYVSNNLDNTISGFSVSPAGALTSLPGFPISTAPYIDPLALTTDPRGKFLYVVAANSNDVLAYSIDAGSGSLTIVGPLATAGTFPNSVTVDPTGRYLVVSNSVSSNVDTYSIDGQSGFLTQVAVSSSTGLGNPYTIAADPSGKRAYVGNGRPSDIIGFGLNPKTGALKQLPTSPYSGVSAPYSLSFDLSGSFLYVANDSGNSVSGYSVNRTNGALTPVPGSPFPAGSGPTGVTVIDSIRP
jgi:6-phosphogluconolactonase (cycloisomerase 2 family)